MDLITAFVAKSFAQDDQEKVRIIETFLSSFAPIGFSWETAEAADAESVSFKVQELIAKNHVFVGIFTKRSPIYKRNGRLSDAIKALLGKPPSYWTPPPWLLQESGYALAI